MAEINLRVIYALLQSDWLAQNLELERRKHGRSTQTYFYLPPPAHFRTRMRINGKIRLTRETRVRACVCLIVSAFVSVFVGISSCMSVFWWVCVRVCVCVPKYLFVCWCACMCVCERECVLVCGFVSSRGCVYERACVCLLICVSVLMCDRASVCACVCVYG